MVLKLKAKTPSGVLHSNKLPPPAFSPDPNHHVHQHVFPDERIIWRSFPVPDRIAFDALLMPKHFGLKPNDAENLLIGIEDLANGLAGAQISNGAGTPGQGPNDKFPKRFGIPLGLRGSRVFIDLRKKELSEPALTTYRMRMEFNPRKLGPIGFAALEHAFFQGTHGSFYLDYYLSDAVVKRLDVAIDYSDVYPAELIITAKGQGKRVEYFGNDGTLETVQVHTRKRTPKWPLKKKPKNAAGTLIVKLYDRNRERASVGKEPPIPDHQVTRMEVVRTRFKAGTGLPELLVLPNPFARVALSYAAGMTVTHANLWPEYLALRRALGHAEAARLLELGPGASKSMSNALRKHPSNLLGDEDWNDWHTGLKATGLMKFIALAAAAAKA